MQCFTFPFLAMGSSCEVKLYAPNEQDAKQVVLKIISVIKRLEQRYSRYIKHNLLFDINAVAKVGGSIDVDDETAALLNYANTCFINSDGLFDISSGVLQKAWDFNSGKLPKQELIDSLLDQVGWDKIIWQSPRLSFLCSGMELDFGGVVKEYAADQSASICLQLGFNHGLINLGGDIRIIGPHPDNKPWSIGIRHPRNITQHYRQIQISRGGVSSSGDYERCVKIGSHYYSHILNPKTGWPVSGLASVTVIADFCLLAGSVSTIAMLKENQGKKWLESTGLGALYVGVNGEVGEFGGTI